MRHSSWGIIVLLAIGCGPRAGQEAPPPSSPAEGAPATAGAPAPSAQGGACNRPQMFGPVIVPEATYAARTGASVARFADIRTTPQAPLEECGLEAVLNRLVTLTCSDGTNPFAGDLNAAHASRSGNIGPGGRCGTIIDRYVVPCPEASYEVHADMYLCNEAGAASWM